MADIRNQQLKVYNTFSGGLENVKADHLIRDVGFTVAENIDNESSTIRPARGYDIGIRVFNDTKMVIRENIKGTTRDVLLNEHLEYINYGQTIYGVHSTGSELLEGDIDMGRGVMIPALLSLVNPEANFKVKGEKEANGEIYLPWLKALYTKIAPYSVIPNQDLTPTCPPTCPTIFSSAPYNSVQAGNYFLPKEFIYYEYTDKYKASVPTRKIQDRVPSTGKYSLKADGLQFDKCCNKLTEELKVGLVAPMQGLHAEYLRLKDSLASHTVKEAEAILETSKKVLLANLDESILDRSLPIFGIWRGEVTAKKSLHTYPTLSNIKQVIDYWFEWDRATKKPIPHLPPVDDTKSVRLFAQMAMYHALPEFIEVLKFYTSNAVFKYIPVSIKQWNYNKRTVTPFPGVTEVQLVPALGTMTLASIHDWASVALGYLEGYKLEIDGYILNRGATLDTPASTDFGANFPAWATATPERANAYQCALAMQDRGFPLDMTTSFFLELGIIDYNPSYYQALQGEDGIPFSVPNHEYMLHGDMYYDGVNNSSTDITVTTTYLKDIPASVELPLYTFDQIQKKAGGTNRALSDFRDKLADSKIDTLSDMFHEYAIVGMKPDGSKSSNLLQQTDRVYDKDGIRLSLTASLPLDPAKYILYRKPIKAAETEWVQVGTLESVAKGWSITDKSVAIGEGAELLEQDLNGAKFKYDLDTSAKPTTLHRVAVPPKTFYAIAEHKGTVFLAQKGDHPNRIWFSLTGDPTNLQLLNTMDLSQPVVAMQGAGAGVFVFTENRSVYLITGTQNDGKGNNTLAVKKIAENVGFKPHSLVSTDNLVMWLSGRGYHNTSGYGSAETTSVYWRPDSEFGQPRQSIVIDSVVYTLHGDKGLTSYDYKAKKILNFNLDFDNSISKVHSISNIGDELRAVVELKNGNRTQIRAFKDTKTLLKYKVRLKRFVGYSYDLRQRFSNVTIHYEDVSRYSNRTINIQAKEDQNTLVKVFIDHVQVTQQTLKGSGATRIHIPAVRNVGSSIHIEMEGYHTINSVRLRYTTHDYED